MGWGRGLWLVMALPFLMAPKCTGNEGVRNPGGCRSISYLCRCIQECPEGPGQNRGVNLCVQFEEDALMMAQGSCERSINSCGEPCECSCERSDPFAPDAGPLDAGPGPDAMESVVDAAS